MRPTITQDMIPDVTRQLPLTCVKCGRTGTYDVKTIIVQPKVFRSKYDFEGVQFTGYFHCPCESPGPWEPAEKDAFSALVRQADKLEGVHKGYAQLYDKSSYQTTAMSEAYLVDKFQQDPGNGFLCSRIGNLLRACGERAASIGWYEKALELNPADIESRGHLFIYAEEDGKEDQRMHHARLLLEHLLAGARAERQELTDYIAALVVESIAEDKQQWFEQLPASNSPATPFELFVRKAIMLDPDDEEGIEDAVDDLLNPSATDDEPLDPEAEQALAAFHPSLQEAVRNQKLDPMGDLIVTCLVRDGKMVIHGRQNVSFSNGERHGSWVAPAMQTLFRGNRAAPRDIDHYPESYVPHFAFIETHVLSLCEMVGDLTDQELEEIFSTLIRRPDGRSLGPHHDFLWQVCAFWLATNEISQSEYEGVLGALVRSTRRWAVKPVSRLYVQYLKDMFGEAD